MHNECAPKIKNAFEYLFGKNFGNIISPSGALRNQSDQNADDGSDIAAAAQAIGGSDFFKKTFGAIFANGFDFSCWNSAYSPQEALKDAEMDLAWILKQSGIEQSVNQNTVDKLFYMLEVYRYYMQDLEAPKFVSCTRKGGAKGRQLTEAFISYIKGAVIGSLAAQGNMLVENGTKDIAPPHSVKAPGEWARIAGTRSFVNYQVKNDPNSSGGGSNSGGGLDTGNGGTGGGGFDNPFGGGNGGGSSNGNVQTAGTGKIVGIMALAAGAFYMIDKEFSKNGKSSTKKAPAKKLNA